MPLKSCERYYEWEGVGEQWITQEESFDSDFPSKPQKAGSPVAKWVIEDVFGLTLASSDKTKGSTLPGYDIIGRNPYDIINLSLIANIVDDSVFYECYMDGNGVVNYYSIGTSISDIGSHVLYSVDNGEVKMKCDNVMVTGYDPPPKRYTGNMFDLFTFANNLTPSDDGDLRDLDRGNYPFYTTFSEVLGPAACPYKYDGSIEYGGNPDTLDDIDTLAIETAGVYDPDAFESVVTYLYKIEVDFFDQYNTTVQFSDTSTRYVELEGFGKLQTRNWVSDLGYISKYCLEGELSFPDSDVGVILPRSDEYKFKGVSDVYIYGYRLNKIELDYVVSFPEGPDSDSVVIKDPIAPKTFIAHLDTMQSEPFKLVQGDDYIIVRDTINPNLSKIVFSCNVSENHLDKFGGYLSATSDVQFRISEGSIYKNPLSGDYALSDSHTGYLRDVKSQAEVDSREYHSAIIFPVGEGAAGYVVEKIVVVYQWDNPSVIIRDLRNDITTDKLRDSVRINFYPMILKDEPAPIAFSGPGTGNSILLNQTEVRPDYDPSTAQNFEPTEYAKAMSSMEAGDVRVSMPFADGDGCKIIANKIKELQTDIAHDVVYMCSPEANPILGEKFGDGVINEIEYSYQDSSQYMISVTVGPQWRGGSSWDNSLYKMETDNPVLTGTVLKVSADNIKVNVRVNKIGVIECINGTKDLLGVGDKVKVTLYNNPVRL